MIKKVILWIWQLPQNLLGLIVILFTKAKKEDGYYSTKKLIGVSLGNYIILWNKSNELRHEQGHQKQSLYLGWLYLFIIGIPSGIGCICSYFGNWSNERYYSQPWEKWADKLGGVNRQSVLEYY